MTRGGVVVGFLAATLLFAACSGVEDTEPTWVSAPGGGIREYYDLDPFGDLCTPVFDAQASGFASCVSAAEADVAASIAYSEEMKRRIRELEVELETRVTTCRDGDGDGICHER
ncbi:hypothetical protein AUC47_11860 [Microbacterium sp. SZ1]|nr:hypothetical protein AUC47_11860 [Microbacterium sp. SZ1]